MKKLTVRQRVAATRRGFGILKQYCPGVVSAGAWCEVLRALQPYVTVWFSARIINEIAGPRRLQALCWYVAGVLVLNFLCAAARGLLEKLFNEKQSLMWCWFRKVFADKQTALDYADFENTAIQQQKLKVMDKLYMFGNGLAQLVWGVPTLVKVAVNLLVPAAMTVSLFCARTGNAAMDHPLWAAALLGILVAAGLGNSRAMVKENQDFVKWCEETGLYNRIWGFYGTVLHTEPGRAKDVRLYRQDEIALQEMERCTADWKKAGGVCAVAAPPAIATVLIGFSNAACYLFVAAKALFGAFAVGSVVQYVTVLTRLGEGIRELMFMLADNQVYCGYLQEMYDYLDLPNAMYQGSLTVEKRDDSEYFVEFRDVSFRYPGTQEWALRHLDLKFRVGEKLAVVGRNGSGKTTFIKLLCRLYDPTEGEILLNGVNIRKYDPDEYRALFSVVFQDYALFAFSLGQNVAAAADYDAQKAADALQKAGFGTRLATLPKGLDTSLYKDVDGEGVEISGGEAQKVALARALYRGAPFVLLDEPTAALDPVSEYEVYSGFDRIAADKTAVYISHRLASCRFCDRIAVFSRGRVIQIGTHAQLLADAGGEYHTLWNAQAQYYTHAPQA